MKWTWILYVLLIGQIPSILVSQPDPAHPGYPEVQVFTSEQDQLLQQVWSFSQDKRGYMYAGCNFGILYGFKAIWIQ